MYLSNCRIVTTDQVIHKGIIEIQDNIIVNIESSQEIKGMDLKGLTVFPGFIDMHIHGANGTDFMDYDSDLNNILSYTSSEGVTSLLATTMTQDLETIKKALKNIANTHSEGTKIAGIHLEGPFLNKKFSGAQSNQFFIQGSKKLIDELQQASNGLIKVVTLAPETQSESFIKYLSENNYIVSMGHTAVSHNDIQELIENGVKRVTHCYNAMSPLHHRDIGLVGSTLLYDELTPEIIPDLVHTSKEAIQLLYKNKNDNMIVITDAIRAKNLEDGTYDLGGQDVEVKDNKALINDTLAGSIVKYNKAVKNIYKTTNCTLQELARMTSLNPAKQLGESNLGDIKESYIADLTVVDDEFDVHYTIINGEVKYKRG